jgi:hypothetical protein
LTQKGNVVTGKKLLIDLVTNQATLIPDEPSKGRTKGDGPAQKPTRIQAILKPDGGAVIGINPFGEAKNKDEPATKPASPPQKPAPSQQSAPGASWQTQSR